MLSAFYSQKLGTEFLLDRLQRTGGFVTADPNAKNDMYYLRAVRSLAEFYYYGTVFRRHDFKGAIVWPQEFREGIESFLESLVTAGRARHYVRNCSTLIKDFLLYLEAVGIFSPKDINSSHLSGFISTLVGFAPVTVSSRISCLRVYLRHLYLESFINEPLTDMLPRTYQFARIKLPTVWTTDETKKILHAVDLGNPCGKRDYAMILLTMRLGLRVGDVRNLKLKDIDWKAKQITIIQSKTKERLTLPLPEDAGWAIIDYLKTGRPVTDCPNVFVRNTPPFDEFTDSNNLHGMITRVIAKADIPPEKKARGDAHLKAFSGYELIAGPSGCSHYFRYPWSCGS